MATWLEKMRKIKENDTRIKRLQETMTHKTQAPIESLRGQDPLTDWALGMRERTLNPLATLASEAKRFQELSPEEMGMELVGGGIAGTIGKGAKRLGDLVGDSRAMSIAPKTEYELAHEVAQRNAALPVEQGGLGLPANNTAMDRAKAMGFDTPAYHGTKADIMEFKAGPNKRFGKGIYTSNDPLRASSYSEGGSGYIDANVLPLLTQSPDLVYASGGINRIDKPSNIRSRFAAFDPMQRNSSNILAGVGAGAVGLSSLAGLPQDDYY